MGQCVLSWYRVSNTLEMYKNSFHICLSRKKRKWSDFSVKESVSPRTWSVSSKELDYVKSQEEAGFKRNSSNICALVMKGGERLWISGMWPVGREVLARPGVTVITDGLSMGKRMPGSPRQHRLFSGLDTNHYFVIRCQYWHRQMYLLIGYWRCVDD